MILSASTPVASLINQYISRYSSWLSITFSTIHVSDLLEIAIITLIVYQVMKWVQLTRAWTLFKGIIVLLLFAFAANVLQLKTISWLLSRSLGVGITAAIIIFQPELRRALEQLGRRKYLRWIFSSQDLQQTSSETSAKTVSEIIKAAYEMGRDRTGALIVIERSVALGDIERTGIPVDGIVSSQLLINIFEHNTPLHDGAVIIRGNRIVSATCYLPITDNLDIGKELGTRHRAAIGISEVSDSLTVVVSEETGKVSVAREGQLHYDINKDEIQRFFETTGISSTVEEQSVFSRMRGRLRNGKTKKQ